MKLFRKAAVVAAIAGTVLAVPTAALAGQRGDAPSRYSATICTADNQSQSTGTTYGLVNVENLGLNDILSGVGVGILGSGVGANPVTCSS